MKTDPIGPPNYLTTFSSDFETIEYFALEFIINKKDMIKSLRK